jgi:pimeloyl-ACP methyl ester carboxylesterase
MLREHNFDAGPVTLNYAIKEDSGPPLVLLHGITQRWQTFLPVLPFLTPSWQTYAVDFRGHGKSGRAGRGQYRGEDYSADVIAFLEQRVGKPAVLLGHSLGGMVSLYLAAQRPELVRAVILGDCILRFQDLERTLYPSLFQQVVCYLQRNVSVQELAAMLAATEVESPQFGRVRVGALPGMDAAYLRAWALSLKQLDPEALNMTLDGRAAATWDGSKLVESVRCPTMLLQADPKYGALMSDADVQCALATIPGAIHVRLEAIGHSLHLYQAAPVVRAVLNFLATLE